MAKRAEEARATIVGKLILDETSMAKLLLIMRRFRDCVELAHTLLFRASCSF